MANEKPKDGVKPQPVPTPKKRINESFQPKPIPEQPVSPPPQPKKK